MPILVQAIATTRSTRSTVASRRDAFCGKLSVCNNLYQYGIPFTDTPSHTCDVRRRRLRAPISTGSRASAASCGACASARIGAIGARTGAFQTMRFSEKLLQASGITVVTVDLSEIIAAAQALNDDAPEVRAG